VAIDELRELVGKGENSGELGASALITAAKDAELAVQRGKDDHPDNSDMLAAEADLRDLLNQAPRALAALEQAFKLNPRQDWLAIRLAKRYSDTGDVARSIEVLQRCLKENPDSKRAHLQLANFLRQSGAPRERIIDHLRRSFTSGDDNFEAQFWYARELFLSGRTSESQSAFTTLAGRAPGRFRTEASAIASRPEGGHVSFDGTVVRKEEGYAFVRLLEFGTDVFASRAESDRKAWDTVRGGSPVSCCLEFNRRGPRVTKLSPRRI
jgi:tetratricopeptide (TPR) repeat protein